MRRSDRATRLGWGGLVIVAVLSGAALVWHALFVPVVIADALVCLVTVVTTNAQLRALRDQARRREHESLHDPVTELANRTLFQQQVNQAIAQTQRSGAVSAVMLLDLDRFNEINDTLGHHQGDLLLHEVGVRLSAGLRAGDLVGRLGGDEFAVFAHDLGSREEAFLLAARIREAIARRIELAGVALEVEVSIGLSLCPDDGDDVEELLSRADIAMYEAKRQRTGVELYDAAADTSSRLRLGLLAELRTAIADDQLVVHYQPKVASQTGEVEGLEALVRWEHPERGLLFPDEFIALAENTGLMRPLTSHVLDRALAQLRVWRDAGHPDLTMAVNLSTRNLLDGALPQEVAARLAAHGLPASALELEITETTLMVDPMRAKAVLVELAAIGVGLAIDDFGTGYTSLSWLGELPITTLKIDRSFVMRMTEHAKDEAIVRSSVQLGHSLGLDVVAEGIEHAGVWQGLAELGCEYLQGYFFSRPQPAEQMQAWLVDQADRVAA